MSSEQGGLMKTIGVIGGMSWESTASYYQLINQGVKSSLGGLHSAKLILNSVDFARSRSCRNRETGIRLQRF